MIENREIQRARIVERRNAIGLTQRDVAALSAVSQPSLARIERGEKLASVPELLGIAHATGTTVGYLTGQSDLMDRVTFAARAERGADVAQVRERLSHLLEMDALLDELLAD